MAGKSRRSRRWAMAVWTAHWRLVDPVQAYQLLANLKRRRRKPLKTGKSANPEGSR